MCSPMSCVHYALKKYYLGPAKALFRCSQIHYLLFLICFCIFRLQWTISSEQALKGILRHKVTEAVELTLEGADSVIFRRKCSN